MPLFTVATVTFNDGPALAATLRSVARQTFSDFQYIVQDGGSTDCTQAIVLGYGDVVDGFVSEPDKGIYDAMNRVARRAEGDYILFLNAQDVFSDSNTLAQLSQALRRNDDVLYGRVINADTNKRHTHKARNLYWTGMTFDHQAALVRTEHVQRLGFDDSLKVSGDLDMFCKLRKEGRTFRELDVDIAIKPFLGGASGDWLKRFVERSRVLETHFGTQFPVRRTLQTELAEYVAREAGCDAGWVEETHPDIDDMIAFARRVLPEE